MITINKLPLKSIEDTTKAIRPIGGGFMGLADAMYKLKIKYNSKEGLAFAERIAATMRFNFQQASIDLAEERGVFPAWQGSEWQKKGIKIRNSMLLSEPPTGSISFIAGVSGGCEPNYALVYTRRTYDGTLYKVVNPIFKEELQKRGIYSEELIEKISQNNGSCKGIKEIPQDIQDIFVTAMDISAKDHVDMVAVLQKHIDSSLSKTVNFLNNATVEDIFDNMIYCWKSGIKGISYYRESCRANQTLSTASTYKKPEPVVEQVIKQEFDYITPPTKNDLGETSGTNIKTTVACGNLYINLCKDEEGHLVEAFVTTGKGGICQSNINAISRLTSLALRSGVKVDEIIDQLGNINCPACSILKSRGNNVEKSCPDAIARYLKSKYKGTEYASINKKKVEKEEKIVNKTEVLSDTVDSVGNMEKMKCRSCGSEMRMVAGCIQCDNCGDSKCG